MSSPMIRSKVRRAMVTLVTLLKLFDGPAETLSTLQSYSFRAIP